MAAVDGVLVVFVMNTVSRYGLAVDIEFPGVKIASCSECGRGIELESPVHADLSLWCDVC